MKDKTMFDKYYSLAQSFSTQYLESQVEQVKHQRIKFEAFNDALKTRLFLNKHSNNGQALKK